MKRHLMAAILVTTCIWGCTSYPPPEFFTKAPSDNAKYRAAKPSCQVPEFVKGMHRIHPSTEQIDEIWRLLDPPKGSYIEYWFEDKSGNSKIGITDGSRYLEAELLFVGGQYRLKDEDSWGLGVICVG